MLIAFLTDLHANREATTACLEFAAEQGAERYVFLGDLVGYGADPGWVVDTVCRYVAEGAMAVRGNHDVAVIHEPSKAMHDSARLVATWTRDHLDAAQIAFIESLPLSIEEDDRLYVHANAWAPAEWGYVMGPMDAARSLRATRQRLTFLGHVHEPALYHGDWVGKVAAFAPRTGVDLELVSQRRWVVLPGSVGQPRDGNPAACCALYDTTRNVLRFERVPYDVDAAAARVRAAGLPAALATRLERGG